MSEYRLENTSGRGPDAALPPELRGWNWGAFFLNWVWGLGNKTFIALLMFVPPAMFVMPFVLGAKGNQWAWGNTTWESTEHFRKVQRLWAWAGLATVTALPTLLLVAFLGVGWIFKNSDVYAMSLDLVHKSPEVQQALGVPIEVGWMALGTIEITNQSGSAEISYSVSGPSLGGTVYVEGTRRLGQWTIEALIVEIDETGRRLDLTPPGR
jgi:hypothetical protein